MTSLQIDLSKEPCHENTLIKIEGIGEFRVDFHPDLLYGVRAALWLLTGQTILANDSGDFAERITILNYDSERRVLEIRIS